MRTRNDVPRLPAEHSPQAQSTQREEGLPGAWRRLTIRAALGCSLLLVTIGLSLLMASCGEKDAQPVADDSRAVVATQQPSSGANSGLTHVASQAGKPKEAETRSGSAPDVSVELADTLVTAGETIELVAHASEDVAEIELRDGLRDQHPFVYDTIAKVWRTSYRVPLRTPWERLGLSVTAKNGEHRWRRVWVFLRIESEGAEPDSAVHG